MPISSIAGQCEGMGKLISAANVALGAYQVACASTQGLCNTACTKLQTIAQKVEADAQAAGTESTVIAAEARAINDYANKNKILKDGNLTGDDVREGLTAVISTKVPEPQF